MDDKIGTLKQAILFQREITFDYVSKNLSVKFDRRIMPREIKDTIIYGYDLDDDNKIKRFLIDGIQKLQIILPYVKEHSHGRYERVHIVALLEKILNDYKLDCMYSKPL